MELNEENLNALAGYLEQTLTPDPAIRRPAEKFLQSVERNANYPLLLLRLLDTASVPLPLRVAAAITLKNLVKRNWKNEEGGSDVADSDRAEVRRLIVEVMLLAPEQVQRQLSDAIATIGRCDFPSQWPNLLAELTAHLKSGGYHVINGCLRTAHSIFERYRFEFKSNELWTEIKYVLDNFAQPLTDLFVSTVAMVEQCKTNADSLQIVVSSLVLICEIFYLLNYQDLPEFFEDNMSVWMPHFLQLLQLDNQLLQSKDDEEPGLLERLRSQLCDNVALYSQKYDEEFQPYLAGFVTAIWSLLVSTGSHTKYDLLVSNAIQFMSSVVERSHNKHLFESDEILSSICEKVIVPNMEFRACDEELFEDNPEEYIRRDVEGSDVDTRRRAACDLVKSLSRQFDEKITQVFSHYVQVMLSRCAENRVAHWKSKDAAIFLVTSLAARGGTQKHGITRISALVNLSDFFSAQILPELQCRQLQQLPVLKADALKFLLVFRCHVAPSIILPALSHVVALLSAPSVVVHSYAAMTMDKLLTVRAAADDKTPLVSESCLAPLATQLFVNLLQCLSMPGSQENEYVMRCIMRSCATLRNGAISHLVTLLPRLTEILQQVAKNPTKPHFNHYLFETLALAIRLVCQSQPSAVTTFESTLFPTFQLILQQDIQEFTPYVFQLLSLMLEVQQSVSPPYQALLPHLLAPVLWQTSANVPPLVRFVAACVRRDAAVFVKLDKLPAILGVFQKLNLSRVNDQHGFTLLTALFESMPQDCLEPYTKQVFLLMFQRLTSCKTFKYVANMLVFVYYFVHVRGPDALVLIVDSVQANMFGMLVERLIVAETCKISGVRERMLCVAGLVRLLCDSSHLTTGSYNKYWPSVMQTLVTLLELPRQQADDEEDDDAARFSDQTDQTSLGGGVAAGTGYQAAFSQLAFAPVPKIDLLKGSVGEPRQYLVKGLQRLSQSQPGIVAKLASLGLQADVTACLQKYGQMLGVTLL